MQTFFVSKLIVYYTYRLLFIAVITLFCICPDKSLVKPHSRVEIKILFWPTYINNLDFQRNYAYLALSSIKWHNMQKTHK